MQTAPGELATLALWKQSHVPTRQTGNYTCSTLRNWKVVIFWRSKLIMASSFNRAFASKPAGLGFEI